MDNIYKAVQLTIDSQNLALSKTPTHVYIANQYVDTNDTPLITAPFIIQKALENGTGVVDIVSSTIGSIYEVRLLCDAEVLISGYFYMPPMNVNFSELELYTSYPPRTPPVVNEFWQKTENFILEKTNTLLNFVQVFNSLSSMRLSLGYLEELATTKKSNLVSAINELLNKTKEQFDIVEEDISGINELLGDVKENGWTDVLIETLENVNQRQINDGLESIAQLLSIKKPRDGMRVYVKSYHAGLNKGGGTFVYDSTKASINDGGMVINGWVRQVSHAYLNVTNFGAKGDGVTNDYSAFKAISDYVKNANSKGYTIHLPTPTDHYAVGAQTFEAGKGFTANTILDISFDTMQDKLILLQSDNAKIKQMSGQYFGAFNKNTKEKLNTTTPIYYNADATTADLKNILHFQNIKSLIMSGKVELDGNRDGMIIGGAWGDTGWQLPAYGIRIANVKQLDIANINSHHHCCDGVYLAGYNDNENPDIRIPDVFGVARNINSQYNSRQGMSLTGGQNISFYDCTFDNTGLPEFSVQSLPKSGVDIEEEISQIRNITFTRCYFGKSGGLSMVADAGRIKDVRFYDCKFINPISSALWVNKPLFKFVDCYVNGRVEKNYATEIDSERTIYQDCTFTDDPAINPNFTNTNATYLFFATGANPKLIDCTFNLYKSGFVHSYDTSTKYPMLFRNVIVNAYVVGAADVGGVGTIRLRDYRPQESRTEKYISFGGSNKITVAVDKTDDIGNKLVPISVYATVYANAADPEHIVFATPIKKLAAVDNSTLTDDTATKLNALLATLKAKGYM